MVSIGALLCHGCGFVFDQYEVSDEAAAGAGSTAPTGKCELDRYRCADGALERCDGKAWLLVERCASQELCKSKKRRCFVCTARSYRCNDQALERCEDGVWVEQRVCEAGQFCDADREVCAVCSEDEVRCDGARLEVCEAGAWVQLRECGDDEVCDAERATCSACVYGETACTGEVGAELLLTCNETRTGWDSVPCPLGCLRSPTPHCKDCNAPGVTVCSNATTLRTCSEDYQLVLTHCPNGCRFGEVGAACVE